ncbi:MAG: biotin--[acetyl-CoA-carboxylase] ligase [Crocinitomicaceae bacterium]|nr:biotin--[acetyl-CoA-carboxylase] ligase [Crocinitomicaceae bacterium]|tara:strand:+ start:812 stop:1561 length:750 start_codon:yes stop_codon:yes gene_type:complete
MNDKEIGNQVIKVKSIDSTNNYAAKLLNQTKVPFGTVIMAHYQTKGKGQRNTIWSSNGGDNLLMSVLLDLSFIPSEKIFFLSKSIALAIRAAVVDVIGIESHLKWPNDVLIDNKKIAGVLIENQWKKSNIVSSVVGVGLNVNQVDFQESFSATSLKKITNKNYNVDNILKVLCKKLNKYYDQLASLKYDNIDLEYHQHLVNNNKFCEFEENNMVFSAKVKGVNQQGELMLEFTNGDVKSYGLKQITQLL